ncbi:MAG TPA: SDR family NAD(P)-dependent oxidoreductase, partial [Longimicrobiales bacterium]|nr:SDR family NAD(P)-dependent oxidoreductase [Longimicrobiales bacterium]
EELARSTTVVALAGDVSVPEHRRRLASAVAESAPLDLLINNASALGPSPLQPLDRADVDAFPAVLATNLVAPLALYQLVVPHLAEKAAVVNITSDASVEAYPGWGLYGASKAGLDQLSAILAAERPDLRVYAFDPGDMRTQMHQDAFPGEDISDRPEPEEVVPAFLALLERRPPSGRVAASEMSIGR